MEQSKQLMRQSIKHSSVYQCQESFMFLKRLVSLSDRFHNKAEMEQAMAKIAPPNMRNTDLEQSTSYHNGAAIRSGSTPPPVPTILSMTKPPETNADESKAALQQDAEAPPQDSSRPQ
jgi:hypothetical protein